MLQCDAVCVCGCEDGGVRMGVVERQRHRLQVQHCAALCCTVLHCVALCSTVFSVVQCVAVCVSGCDDGGVRAKVVKR